MAISLIRTVILYVLVIFAVRIMGKRQIGEMQPTELVVTLMISNIAAIPMENNSIPVLSGAVPIIMLVVIEIFLSYWMMNNTKVRNFISGRPVVVIDDGKIIQQAMKSLRLTVDDLLEDLRKDGIFDIGTVRYAIVETDGTLSVLPKKSDSPVTLSDLKLENSEENFFAAVIQDGKISESALSLINKDVQWLKNTLKKEKIAEEKIFIMTCSPQGKYTIVKRKKNT